MAIILESAVERGAIAQLIGPPALAQKPQLTHRVSPRFCTNAFNPSSCTLHPRSTAESRIIAQRGLFGWDQIEALGDLERLRLVIEHLPDEKLICVLEKSRGRGANLRMTFSLFRR